MWTSKVSITKVRDAARWKVDFFMDSISEKVNSKFDMLSLSKIVKERKEFIDPQAYPDKEFDYVGLENVQTLTGDIIGNTKCLGKTIRSRSKVFASNDILYGRLRPYLNKVYLAQEPISSGICSTEFYVFIPNCDLILPNFIRTVLASAFVQQNVGKWQTGSALPRLQLEDLLGTQIPIPPLSIQYELVEFIQRENLRRLNLQRELENLPERIIGVVSNVLISGKVSSNDLQVQS